MVCVSNCFTARCASIWYGFFIATLLFLGKRKLLLAYQGFERGVATFYDLPGIPSGGRDTGYAGGDPGSEINPSRELLVAFRHSPGENAGAVHQYFLFRGPVAEVETVGDNARSGLQFRQQLGPEFQVDVG